MQLRCRRGCCQTPEQIRGVLEKRCECGTPHGWGYMVFAKCILHLLNEDLNFLNEKFGIITLIVKQLKDSDIEIKYIHIIYRMTFIILNISAKH